MARFKRYISDPEDQWSAPVGVFKNNEPPPGQPFPAKRTKAVASPNTVEDFNKLTQLVSPDEADTLRYILANQNVPNLVIADTVDNGWVDGEIAQDGTLGSGDGRLHLRVFDASKPPPEGFSALPQHVLGAREEADARTAGLTRDIQQWLHPGPVVVTAKPPPRPRPKTEKVPPNIVTRGQTKGDGDQGEDEEPEFDALTVDEDGKVLLQLGEMVAVLVEARTSSSLLREREFPYQLAQFVGLVGEVEFEEDAAGDLNEDGAVEEEAADPSIWIQWFGNNKDERKHNYTADSTFLPGWRDLGDEGQPLMFQIKQPSSRASNVTGPVVRYLQAVQVSSVALHGFHLTSKHKLPLEVARDLTDLATARLKKRRGSDTRGA